MDQNMVLTRQQQRRDRQTSSTMQQGAPTDTIDDSAPDFSANDRVGGESTSEFHVLHSDQLTASLPRESISWSMGDHNSFRNQTLTQNSSTEISQAMQCMQDKVSNLEHSLQSVTAELRGVINRFNHEQNNSSSAIARPGKTHTNSEVPIRRRIHRRNRSQQYTSSSESDDGNNDNDSVSSNLLARVNRGARRNPKLPPFTGKETWKVWFNRFEEVANRQRWTAEDKLDELLPRLQGVAGEFVYEQVSHETRSNYNSLCKELKVIDHLKNIIGPFARKSY